MTVRNYKASGGFYAHLLPITLGDLHIAGGTRTAASNPDTGVTKVSGHNVFGHT